MSMKFRYVGDHAQSLDDGRVVAPGEFVHLSDDEAAEPLAADLIVNGRLLPTGEKSEKTQERLERKAEREARKEESK